MSRRVEAFGQRTKRVATRIDSILGHRESGLDRVRDARLVASRVRKRAVKRCISCRKSCISCRNICISCRNHGFLGLSSLVRSLVRTRQRFTARDEGSLCLRQLRLVSNSGKDETTILVEILLEPDFVSFLHNELSDARLSQLSIELRQLSHQ